MAIDAAKNQKLPKKEQLTTGKTEKSYNSLNILHSFLLSFLSSFLVSFLPVCSCRVTIVPQC